MIFVTGGTGFLGRHLVASLCRVGYSIRVLTRQPQEHQWLKQYPNVTVIHGDLQESDVVKAGIDGCRYVIHAGGLFRFWGDEADFEATNVRGTETVLNHAVQAGVERIIHISTIALVGNPAPDAIIDEDYEPQPADPYQRSKRKGEQVALQKFREDKAPVIILRPGAFYGPLGGYAFNRLFFQDALRGLLVHLDGGNYITFPAYIMDVVQGILLALQKGRIGEIYNICGECPSHKEVFQIIREEANLWYPNIYIPGKLVIGFAGFLTALSKLTRQEPFYPLNSRSVILNNWRVSSEKAKRELGFEPTSFDFGARRTVQWYLNGKPDTIPEIECNPTDT